VLSPDLITIPRCTHNEALLDGNTKGQQETENKKKEDETIHAPLRCCAPLRKKQTPSNKDKAINSNKISQWLTVSDICERRVPKEGKKNKGVQGAREGGTWRVAERERVCKNIQSLSRTRRAHLRKRSAYSSKCFTLHILVLFPRESVLIRLHVPKCGSPDLCALVVSVCVFAAADS
jgi:hypothetical protein